MRRDDKAYRKCLDCDNKVLPPRRKCNACRKQTYTTTVLSPSNRNRNKRGLALHRPDTSHTRRAKRQNPHVLGSRPELVMTQWEQDR